MPELYEILILIGGGIAAGFINVTAGGGSTITLPILLFLGLDGSVANGTNRIAIFMQNLFAIFSFKQEKYSEFGTSLKLAIWTLPGAITGARVASKISNELFDIILGIIMLGVIISILIPKKKNNSNLEKKIDYKTFLFMLGIGFYGGFIQVGVGIIIMAALYNFLNMKLTKTNMHKVFIVFIYTIPALIIFIITNNIDFVLGLSLAIGNSIGGWFAAKLNVKKGDKFIKYILIIAIFLMILKLFKIY
jgi:uncharacterized membrane protein YfcA